MSCIVVLYCSIVSCRYCVVSFSVKESQVKLSHVVSCSVGSHCVMTCSFTSHIHFRGSNLVSHSVKLMFFSFCLSLVNNVGMAYGHPEFFAESSIDKLQTMLKVNMLSAVKVGFRLVCTFFVFVGIFE